MTSRSASRADRLGDHAARRSSTLGALVCVLSGAAVAQTSEPLDLHWQAPPDCPGQAAVYERIRALAGPALQRDGRLQADASVVREGGRFQLKLVLRSGDLLGERTLQSDNCDALAGAAAVALVLLLNAPESLGESEPASPAPGSERPSGSQPSTPAAAPRPPRAPVPAGPASVASDEEPPRESSAGGLRLLVQAPVVTLDVGPLPEPSAGAVVAAGLRFGAWHLLLGVQLSLPQTVAAEDYPGYGARVRRAAAESWACHGFRSSRFELAPCLLLALERVTASGESDYIRSSADDAIWFSGGAGALARWYALDSVALVVGVGGRIEASRPQIEISGLGQVQQLWPAAVTMRIGSEWIW